MACPYLCAALEVLGKRWSGLIIDVLGVGDARFSELAHRIPALSERMLNERLKELTEAGLVHRQVEPGPPVAVVYGLTPLGRKGGSALEAMREFGMHLHRAWNGPTPCRPPTTDTDALLSPRPGRDTLS